MQLILSMQDENGQYPNVGYVKEKPQALPVRKIEPSADPQDKFKYLRDMLILVDKEVYKAFHRMLNEEGTVKFEGKEANVNSDVVADTAKKNSWVLQRVNDLYHEDPKDQSDPMYPNGVLLWDCFPPHPIPLVIREVVADLLADRLD